jgi:hypothetical protein
LRGQACRELGTRAPPLTEDSPSRDEIPEFAFFYYRDLLPCATPTHTTSNGGDQKTSLSQAWLRHFSEISQLMVAGVFKAHESTGAGRPPFFLMDYPAR